MSLYAALQEREARGEPVRAGLIGAGKFGTMFLASARTSPGLQVLGIADLSPDRARDALARAAFEPDRGHAPSAAAAAESGDTWITDDVAALVSAPEVDVVLEATGNPYAGVSHALLAGEHGKHLVMVTVEADALCGPELCRRVEAGGGIYSFAYGDQPALICELVDWARATGLEVVCAGKGTKHLPEYHHSTPETVWGHYGFTDEEAQHLNPQMFNSFLDGTKSAIEMAAVANATGLRPPPDGLEFPPAGVSRLATVLRPREEGGILPHSGTVEVVSSLERDGSQVPEDLRWGVYVVVRAPSDYVATCWGEYGVTTDPSGRYSALHRPYHYIGLELGLSAASVVLRGEPTGKPMGFHGDVVATSKRALEPGEQLDGEGGYAVYGRLATAADSLERRLLPVGLAHGVEVIRAVAADTPLSRDDVRLDPEKEAVQVRDALEAAERVGASA